MSGPPLANPLIGERTPEQGRCPDGLKYLDTDRIRTNCDQWMPPELRRRLAPSFGRTISNATSAAPDWP